MTTLPDILQERATVQPNDIAIITPFTKISWLQLNNRVNAAAKQLTIQNAKSGNRVGLYADTSVNYIVTLLAAIRTETVVVLFSTRFTSKMTISLIKSFHCRIIQPLVPNHQIVEENREQHTLQADQPSVVIFTSGTTATPKAALLSYGNLYYSALGANERVPFMNGNNWLLSLPLYHVGGLGILFRALVSGGTITIPSDIMSLTDAIAHFQPTHLSLVPTQLYRLLRQKTKLPKTATIVMGGAPLSPALAQQAIDAGCTLYASYGLTEMASQVCTKRITTNNTQTVGCGMPLNYRQLRLSPQHEIEVKGKTLFLGYCEPNNQLRKPFTKTGWFPTGDIGYFDAQGSLHVTGRKDNMFISGGENIFPEEIEAALLQLTGVEEAIVVPITDPEFGARPVAFVRCTARLFDENHITQQLTMLPRYKLPVRIFPWPLDMPMDQMKPNRAQFKQLADELVRKST